MVCTGHRPSVSIWLLCSKMDSLQFTSMVDVLDYLLGSLSPLKKTSLGTVIGGAGMTRATPGISAP